MVVLVTCIIHYYNTGPATPHTGVNIVCGGVCPLPACPVVGYEDFFL